jgi:hypothetical protein
MVRIRVRQSNRKFVEVDGQQLAKGKRWACAWSITGGAG